MGRDDAASRTSRARSAPGGPDPTHVWAVVLAGGDGAGLRSLIRGVFPGERPKQYVPLMGPVSLFRQTLDRVARLVPEARTVIVSQHDQRAHITRELHRGSSAHVLF